MSAGLTRAEAERRDTEGQILWKRITAAVNELQRRERANDEALN